MTKHNDKAFELLLKLRGLHDNAPIVISGCIESMSIESDNLERKELEPDQTLEDIDGDSTKTKTLQARNGYRRQSVALKKAGLDMLS